MQNLQKSSTTNRKGGTTQSLQTFQGRPPYSELPTARSIRGCIDHLDRMWVLSLYEEQGELCARTRMRVQREMREGSAVQSHGILGDREGRRVEEGRESRSPQLRLICL